MEARKENKMGIQPVGKLLVSMSLPVMVSMLIQALYNIVDRANAILRTPTQPLKTALCSQC